VRDYKIWRQAGKPRPTFTGKRSIRKIMGIFRVK
jgi:hypothetical protein